MSGEAEIRWPDRDGPDRLPVSRAGSLAEDLAAAGRPLNTRCGRRGQCAGCTVRLARGDFRLHDGQVVSGPAAVKACQGHVVPGSGAVIEVPARALAAHLPQITTSFQVNVPSAQNPLLAAGPDGAGHGLAIDVGTTTVVVALVDLATGAIVGEVSGFNRQIELGDNVLTRIEQGGTPAGRAALRDAIVARTLTPLIGQVCRERGVDPARVAGATVAGNTTMLHLLTGTDPTPLGVAPFRAAFLGHRELAAGSLGLAPLRADAAIHLLPGFSAYVGADLVAGSFCTGLIDGPGPALLVDVGTNGEIVLRSGDRLLATATAAGPAFEGGRLSCGTRAVAGAIERVAFPPGRFPPEVGVIGDRLPAVGVCGSAYVDFLAAARRAGLLRAQGRLEPAAWAATPAEHRFEQDGSRGLRLRAGDDHTVVTEADVAHLLQAKAAIAAGIKALLRRAGCAPGDLAKVYLAGGFGFHLDVPNAIACGLLPDFQPGQVEVVGNTSLGGAWLALVDRGALEAMSAAATGAEIVELNLEPDFEDTFIGELALP